MGAHGYPGEGSPVAVLTQRLKFPSQDHHQRVIMTPGHCDGMTRNRPWR